MYGIPPLLGNNVQWTRQRAPYNPQWRPFYEPRPPFRPRNQSFSDDRSPMHGGSVEHWCETCDREFPSEDLLSKHKQQHQKCNIDGCQFIAHPKVITKHIQMQHSSGLYKKIAKLNNPEEIEKWREERRKKYPTKNNIDNKAAALKEKIERGEKMNLARKEWHNRRDNDQNKHSNSGQGMKRNYNNINNNQPESKFRKTHRRQPQASKTLPEAEENHSLVPFAGIQSLGIDSNDELDDDCSNDLIEDDEIVTIDKELVISECDISRVEKPVVCSALSSLMCEYGTSDEETGFDKSKQDFNSKEVKVDKIDKSHIWKKESDFNQANKLNESKDLLQKSKNNDFSKNVKEKIQSQQNSGTECAVSSELSQYPEHSRNDPEEKVTKHETAFRISGSSSKPVELAINNDKPPSKTNDAIDYDNDDSGPEEVKVDKNVVTTANLTRENYSENKNNIVKKKMEVVKRKPIFRKSKPKVPSTLIYRLLSNEMKHERNQVLQCIRYIRINNYFD